jgi:hypothetical protein
LAVTVLLSVGFGGTDGFNPLNVGLGGTFGLKSAMSGFLEVAFGFSNTAVPDMGVDFGDRLSFTADPIHVLDGLFATRCGSSHGFILPSKEESRNEILLRKDGLKEYEHVRK